MPFGPAGDRERWRRALFAVGPWRLAVGIAVGLASFAGLARFADLQGLGGRLGSVKAWWLVPFFAAWSVATLLRVVRWGFLFPSPIRPATGQLFDAFGAGSAVNCILPGRAGDVGRAMLVGHGIRQFGVAGTLGTLVMEKVLDGLAVCVMFAAVLLFAPLPGESKRFGLLFVVLFAAAFLAARAFQRRRRPEQVARGESGISVRDTLARRVHELADRLAAGLSVAGSISMMARLLVVSFAIWALEVAVVYGGFVALGLEKLPIVAALTATVFIAIGTMLPAAPGFVGTYQLVVVAALAPFAVPSGTAVAVGIVLNAAMVLFSLSIGAIAAVRMAVRNSWRTPESPTHS